MNNQSDNSHPVVIIGAGPAGLMAAEVISQQGIPVALYDAMSSIGRKFLMAGKSGLNLTHAEPLDAFLSRYNEGGNEIAPIIRAFPPDALRDWAKGLGIDTYTGSSGRVFPSEMKAAPLLRAWRHRLREAGVQFHMRHKWLGYNEDGQLRFATDEGETSISATATVLALGGGSWARLGSTGDWIDILKQQGITISPLKPSNCGFEVNWSDHLRQKYAGAPVKSVMISVKNQHGKIQQKQGDFVISDYGIEGSLIYPFAASIRDVIEQQGKATIYLDLIPTMEETKLADKLSQPRGKRSLTDHLRRQLKISGIKTALIYEVSNTEQRNNPQHLASIIKALPITCQQARPMDEAISTAGGISFDALNQHLMLKQHPGTFCAGEMLDWDAPTGGYLLTACFASGYVAGEGLIEWLKGNSELDKDKK